MPADANFDALNVTEHPLISHTLTLMRDENTPNVEFRRLMRAASYLLAYEAMADCPMDVKRIKTPVEEGEFPVLHGPQPCFVSILRAGNGLLDGFLDFAPEGGVGHLGLERNEETLKPSFYCLKLPQDISAREVYILDPMLATGGSAVYAVDTLKEQGAERIKFVSLLAAPAGVEKLSGAHPDVRIFCGALDRELNENGFIMPGLGDAGDRIYATK